MRDGCIPKKLELENEQLYERYFKDDEGLSPDEFYEKYASKELLEYEAARAKRYDEAEAKGIIIN